jgi:hypothetical protein
MAPAGAGAMGRTMGGNQSMGQPMGQSMGGHGAPSNGAPSYGGQQQMSPAMTQPMAPVRPQAPQPMQQAPSPMRGFLIDEDDN